MYLFLCVYSSILLHICVCTTGTAAEARREYCIPGAAMGMLGMESMSSERALNANNHCAISPVPKLKLLTIPKLDQVCHLSFRPGRKAV